MIQFEKLAIKTIQHDFRPQIAWNNQVLSYFADTHKLRDVLPVYLLLVERLGVEDRNIVIAVTVSLGERPEYASRLSIIDTNSTFRDGFSSI